MRMSGAKFGWLLVFAMTILVSGALGAPVLPETAARIEAALKNITNLVRPGAVGYATIWDGNKYVQCRSFSEGKLRCEAAGLRMQPSLRHVLVPERLNTLRTLDWAPDPAFGNYAHTFPAGTPSSTAANAILQTLAQVYEAELSTLDIETTWAADVQCPPRNGPSQNLAGIVNDAPSMRATAVEACSYVPPAPTNDSESSLSALYGARVEGEVERLRINSKRPVFVIFGAGIGYVQCMPDPALSAIYCEAQSTESWPALAAILTVERVSLLHAKGYADPGRSPNYWKNYSLDVSSDASIASEILTILHDVYGYNGAEELSVLTE